MSTAEQPKKQPEVKDAKFQAPASAEQSDWRAKGAESLAKAEQDIKDIGKLFENDEFAKIAEAKFNKTKDFLNAQGIDEQNLIDYLKTQTLDAAITHPTNTQIVQAIKDWQELHGLVSKKGLEADGVIGKKTFAKIKQIPDLMVALKKEKPVWARAAEGQDSQGARKYETSIPKGTTYRFQNPDKTIITKTFGETTPAIVQAETQYAYTVGLTDGRVVKVPKSQGVVLERSRYAQRTMDAPDVAAKKAEHYVAGVLAGGEPGPKGGPTGLKYQETASQEVQKASADFEKAHEASLKISEGLEFAKGDLERAQVNRPTAIPFYQNRIGELTKEYEVAIKREEEVKSVLLAAKEKRDEDAGGAAVAQ